MYIIAKVKVRIFTTQCLRPYIDFYNTKGICLDPLRAPNAGAAFMMTFMKLDLRPLSRASRESRVLAYIRRILVCRVTNRQTDRQTAIPTCQ